MFTTEKLEELARNLKLMEYERSSYGFMQKTGEFGIKIIILPNKHTAMEIDPSSDPEYKSLLPITKRIITTNRLRGHDNTLSEKISVMGYVNHKGLLLSSEDESEFEKTSERMLINHPLHYNYLDENLRLAVKTFGRGDTFVSVYGKKGYWYKNENRSGELPIKLSIEWQPR